LKSYEKPGFALPSTSEADLRTSRVNRPWVKWENQWKSYEASLETQNKNLEILHVSMFFATGCEVLAELRLPARRTST